MLLKVVTNTWNVSGYFHAINEANTSYLTKCRIRLLRGSGVNTSAYAALLRVAFERRGLLFVDLLGAALADQLI